MDRNLKVGWVSNFWGDKKKIFKKIFFSKNFFFKSCRKFYNSFKNIVGDGGGQKNFWQQNFFLAVGKCIYYYLKNADLFEKMPTYSTSKMLTYSISKMLTYLTSKNADLLEYPWTRALEGA